MVRFSYRAKNAKGHSISGIAEARNETELHERLSKLGLTITKITEQKLPSPRAGTHISAYEMTLLCKQFHYALAAGLDVLQAIDSIALSTDDRRLLGVLAALEAQLRQGRMLSEAFAAFPRLFEPFMVACIQAAEASGRLAFAFEQLEAYYQHRMLTRRRLLQALRYPLFSTLFTSGLIFLLAAHLYFLAAEGSWVVPGKVMQYLLVSPASFMYMQALIVGGLGFVALRFLHRRIHAIACALDRMLLALPLAGPIFAAYDHARLCLFMAMLYDCGIPMGDATKATANIMTNHYLRRRVLAVAQRVRTGLPPSEAFAQARFKPEGFINGLALGEKTGNFAAPLHSLHQNYRAQADDRLDALLQWLRPALLAFSAAFLVGGMSGF